MTAAERPRRSKPARQSRAITPIPSPERPATPHFAYQLRARVREVIADLPDDHPVRRYGEEKMQLLDDLGHASSKAEDSPREARTRMRLHLDVDAPAVLMPAE